MWILPTYNRPELLEQTLRLCAETGVSTKGLILVNGSKGYERAVSHAPLHWSVEHLPENLGWAQACNYAFEKYPDEPWYGFFYDDMKPITQGWDRKLVEACKSGHIVSAINNWHGNLEVKPAPNPHRIQTAVIDGDLAREVGFLTIPGTWACYTDDFWEQLGNELGIWTIMEDVVVETLNPRKGDYAFDDAHNTAYATDNFDKDMKVWAKFCQAEYKPLRERVRKRFEVGAKREADLTECRVLIATPCLNGKTAVAYVGSLTESLTVMNKHGIGFGIRILTKTSNISYARNRLLAEFLKTEATHILFIDDDMGWPANTVPELLAHGKDVMAAVGITKDEDPDQRRFCVDLDSTVTEYDPTRGIMQVKQVGTGLMLIKRHVIEKMWAKHSDKAVPEPREAPGLGKIHWVFDEDRDHPEGWGEDYTFCRRWREMGGEVWIDPSVRMEHIGEYTYSGTYLDWLHSQYKKDQAA